NDLIVRAICDAIAKATGKRHQNAKRKGAKKPNSQAKSQASSSSSASSSAAALGAYDSDGDEAKTREVLWCCEGGSGLAATEAPVRCLECGGFFHMACTLWEMRTAKLPYCPVCAEDVE